MNTRTDNRTARSFYTPNELAALLDTTPYKVRKYLRADNRIDNPGRGGRWLIPAHFATTSLIRRFRNWDAEGLDPRPVAANRI